MVSVAGPPNDVALFDPGPLRQTLERLIDFDLLNSGPVRLGVCCVDIETGDEVCFETTRDRIRSEHLLAGMAFTPGFPPVEIDGRLLCDAGYVNSTPIDHAFLDPPTVETLCIAVELFSLRSPRPKSLDPVLERSQDLMFASPTRRSVEALKREYGLCQRLDPGLPSINLVHLAYQAASHELATKTLDFQPSSLRERWAAGARDADTALETIRLAPRARGLTCLPVT